MRIEAEAEARKKFYLSLIIYQDYSDHEDDDDDDHNADDDDVDRYMRTAMGDGDEATRWNRVE